MGADENEVPQNDSKKRPIEEQGQNYVTLPKSKYLITF